MQYFDQDVIKCIYFSSVIGKNLSNARSLFMSMSHSKISITKCSNLISCQYGFEKPSQSKIINFKWLNFNHFLRFEGYLLLKESWSITKILHVIVNQQMKSEQPFSKTVSAKGHQFLHTASQSYWRIASSFMHHSSSFHASDVSDFVWVLQISQYSMVEQKVCIHENLLIISK